jgi:two-component system chemotaxis sensor kinase CheA
VATQSPSPRPGRVSVGRKLSAATLAVVVLVAIAVYLGLSRYERSTQFLAKETAAVMVMRLFAANLSAPLTFADATSVAETVSSVSSNPEIEFGAAWASNAKRAGQLGEPLGVLSRGGSRPAAPRSIPTTLQTRYTETHVIVEAPVRDPSGKVVGAAQLGFSTAREAAAIADIERRVLGLSMGSALGLLLILSLASRAVVVRPLRTLTRATAALKRGEKPELLVPSNDEIGELTHAFMDMSRAIETREQRISDRNRDMLRILDNAEDGFITVSRAGVMSDERSQILERWFGPAEGPAFLDYFGRICPDLDQTMRLSWDALVDAFLPLDLLLDQMPKAFAREGRHFQVRYRAVPGPDSEFESLLVVINDATEAVERDRAEQRQRETLVILRRLMTDAAEWEQFFDDGSRMVEQLVGAAPPGSVVTRRLVHTLKGNCAVMGLESTARFMHELEWRLSEGPARLMPEDAQALARRWSELGAICNQLGSATARSRRIAISLEEHEELLLALERSSDLKGLVPRVLGWRDEPVIDRLERLREQIESVARRLGKSEPRVSVEADGLRVPASAFAGLWGVLAHVVRNTVDHGLQTEEEREACGKVPENRVCLQASAQGERGFVLSISDDGRGIDWDKLAEKAAAAGLPAGTRSDLEEALFADSISTRDEVSETSGRGVGLGAVRAVVTALGGSVEVESVTGEGTTFRIALPWPVRSMSSPPNAPGAQLRRSLAPPVGRAPNPLYRDSEGGRA